MNRRQFLGASAAGASLVMLEKASIAQTSTAQNRMPAPPFTPPTRAPLYQNGDWKKPLRALRGVNLGGWLVLEKWMTPAVFKGVDAPDEFRLSQTAGGRERIEKHRDSFITEADFRWIAEYGLDAVRIPVGYWALKDVAPYFGSAKHLQRAFDWAQKYDLKVLLDLHGAQGSQNGMDHSGHAGPVGWTTPENQAASLQTLVEFANAYGKHPNLWGLQLVNEPLWSVPMDLLQAFTTNAYQTLRPLLPANVAIVMHDGFRMDPWKGFGADLQNMVLDTHHYQIYTQADRDRTLVQQVQLALEQTKRFQDWGDALPIIVGEWSIGLPGDSIKNKNSLGEDTIRMAYAGAQLMAYETTRGWFYWSYKTEYGGEWSFRDCVKRGWMPPTMARPATKV